MEEKIKKTLGLFENINYDVFYDDILEIGYVDLTVDYISINVLLALSGIVNITAIRHLKDNQYRINFITE